MNILVIGGAGYIGSHMVQRLLDTGYRVVILDNLSSGHIDALAGGEFVHGDLANRALLDAVFSTHRFDCVFHFACHSLVGDSIRDPALYYSNNLSSTINLLQAMSRHKARHLVLASSAAIFGESCAMFIDERHPIQPTNPYGRSIWMIEQMLADFDGAYGIKSTALRYFNVAGVHPSGKLGERHTPETHLIPRLLQAVTGRLSRIEIYGRDYGTPDGTPVRDYIHVMDICEANLLAMRRLLSGGKTGAYNIGSSQGASVLEVVAAVERITGKRLTIHQGVRRLGDPSRVVANAELARTDLAWRCRYSLNTIIEDAWRWEKGEQEMLDYYTAARV